MIKHALVILMALMLMAVPRATPSAYATSPLYPTLHSGGNYPTLTWTDFSGEDHYRLGRQDNFGSFSYSNLAANTVTWSETTGSFDTLCYTLEAMDSSNNRLSDAPVKLCSLQGGNYGTIAPYYFTLKPFEVTASCASVHATMSVWSGTTDVLIDEYDITAASNHQFLITSPWSFDKEHCNSHAYSYTATARASGTPYGHTDTLSIYP